MPRIQVVLAHPQLEHSRIARALAAATRGLAGSEGNQIELIQPARR